MMEIVPFISLEAALKEKKILPITYERVMVAKKYIEKKYRLKKEEEEEKKKDWEEILSRMNEMNLPDSEANKIKNEILHKESESLRKKRQKISIFDFQPIKIIGKGAFGEVRVCRYIPTDDIVAIKKMKKDEMHKKNQVLHVRAERDVLSEAKNEWIVSLKFSFQDQKYLYLGMEFLPGGDLMSLLMARDILPENDAKFYAAEMVLAIESVHKLDCIHRDLKPDNVLIDKDGHIKLSDFGLSKKLDIQIINEQLNIANANDAKNIKSPISSYAQQFSQFKSIKSKKKRAYAFSTVGTPDYIAPEVFTQKGYGQEIDWWSLGVIMFEMMIGYPPFFSNSSAETCKKILDWKNTLNIRKEAHLSPEAEDILRKLINDADKRLGKNGSDEVKNHPFFRGINWNHIKETMVPPFIPELDSNYDTKYFDDFDEDEPFYPLTSDKNPRPRYQKKDMCFVDFTYNRERENDYRNNMVTALEIFDSIQENIRKINMENNRENMRKINMEKIENNEDNNGDYDLYEEGYINKNNQTENNNDTISAISNRNRIKINNNTVQRNSFTFNNNNVDNNNQYNTYSNSSKYGSKSKLVKSQKSIENYDDTMEKQPNDNYSGSLNSLSPSNYQEYLSCPNNIQKKPKTKTFFTNKAHYIPVNRVQNQNKSDNIQPFKKPLSKIKIPKKIDIKDVLIPKDPKSRQVFRPLTQSNNNNKGNNSFSNNNNNNNNIFQHQINGPYVQRDSMRKTKVSTPRIGKNENNNTYQEKSINTILNKFNSYRGGFTYVKPDVVSNGNMNTMNRQSNKRK